ncbi:MAG: hypothetical protein JSS27_11065 [Planctomycetes bacterium]|nr:hypothetical protein [Planctomycetota bacterium]
MSKSSIPLVFGLLNLLWGALGLLSAVTSVLWLFLMGMSGGTEYSTQLMRESSVLTLVSGLGVAVGLVASLVLIVAGVGLLKERAWGRRWSIGVAWCDISTAAIYAVSYLPLFWLPLAQHAGTIDDSNLRFSEWFSLIASILTVPISLIYPVLTLYFLNRPNVLALLDSSRDPGAGYVRQETGNPYQSP